MVKTQHFLSMNYLQALIKSLGSFPNGCKFTAHKQRLLK